MAIKLGLDVSADEYRVFKRLTQKVNRRIKDHMKKYVEHGYNTIPKELTARLPRGSIQNRKDFIAGSKTPLSRGLGQFSSKDEFDRVVALYKRMVDQEHSAIWMPRMSEYADINREKLKAAFITLGIEPPLSIEQMDTVQIKKFWEEFQKRAARKGMAYSSDAVMEEMLHDYGKDLQYFVKTKGSN